MNKFFKAFFVCFILLLSHTAFAQYQFPDSGFEDWSGATFDGNIQPKYWNFSNVEQLGVKKNFAHQAQGRTGNCLLIQDQFVGVGSIGATSPGYVALGMPWAYVSSLTSINDATAGCYGGIAWTNRPDSVAVWIKRVYDSGVDQAAGDHTADENFNIVYYAWTGTAFGGQYKAKNGTCTNLSTIKPEYCTDEESDIRIAVNGNECGTSQPANQVAEGWYKEMRAYPNWTRIVVPIFYMSDVAPQKCNLIFSAGNYPNFRANNGINAGNSLYVDDVQLIYTSKIQKLYVNNREWKGFDPDNTTTEQIYSLGQGATVVPDIYAVRGSGALTNAKGQTTNFAGRRLTTQECTIQKGAVDGAATIITVQSEDGSSTSTYRIRFVSQASNNAKLADIKVNGQTIAGFNAYLTSYNVQLPYGTTAVPQVTAEAQDAGATVQIQQPTSTIGTATITVTAQDGSTTQTYTLAFSVAQLADVTLQNILIDGENLPGFTPAKANYTVSLPLGTTAAPQVTPVSAYPQGAQTITILQNSLTNGCQIQVSAPGATSPKIYKITYRIEASTYSNLADIKLAGQSLDNFTPEEMVYYVNLPLGTTALPAITWTQGDRYQTVVLDQSGVVNLEGTATITVTAASGAQSVYRLVFALEKSVINTLSMIYLNGQPLADFNANTLSYTVELPIGTATAPVITWDQGDEYQTVTYTGGGLSGTSRIVVKAQNGATRIYQIAFSVATSSDATLSMIYLDGEPLATFDPAQLTYNIPLPQGTTQLPTVTYLAHDEYQTISTRPATSLNGEYKIIVKPQTGAAQTYILRFSVATSANNALQSILLSGEPLTTFHPDTLNYIDTLPAGVSAIPSVTYVKGESSQKVQMLTSGTTVTLNVTAENGERRTYTLQFVVLKSENAFLRVIRLGADTLPGFNPQTLNYVVSLSAQQTVAPVITVEKNAGQQVLISQPQRLGVATITVTPEQGAPNIYRIQFIDEGQTSIPDYPADPTPDPLPTDASLQSILLNGSPLAGFQPAQLHYSALTRQSGEPLPVLSFVKGHPDQTIAYSQAGPDSIAIIVMAPAGNQQTYTLSFDYQLATDATLHTLTLNNNALDGFDPAINSYTVNLAADEPAPAIAFTAHPAAVVAIAENADSCVIDLWAEDRVTHQQYTIYFVRAQYTSAQLTTILLDGTPLEGFDAATLTYTVNLPWHATQLPAVTVTTAEPVASVALHYGSIGDTTRIQVTAQDNIHTATYAILFRSPLSNDTTLQSIEISGVDFSFDPAQRSYAVTLPYGTTAVPEFIVEKALAEQEVIITRAAIGLPTTVTVIAEDGTRADYIFHFTVAPSTADNKLLGIVVDGVGALDMAAGPNFNIDLPYGSTTLTVANVVKAFPEQTVIIENGGAYAPTLIRVNANRNGEAEMVYTLTPNVYPYDPAMLTAMAIDGVNLDSFNPAVFDYVVVAPSAATPAVTFTAQSGAFADQSTLSNTKCVLIDVENGDYLHTYRVWFYYPFDLTFDLDFEDWVDFTNPNVSADNSGFYPRGWYTPLNAPTSGDKGTYHPNKNTYESATATSGAKSASLNTYYITTSAESMPGFISLSEPTVAIGTYYIFSHTPSTLSFGSPIAFRNSPDSIRFDYQYQASNKVTGWRMSYIANGVSQIDFSEAYASLTPNQWRTFSRPINYSADFVPATLDIRISATHTDNLGSFYVGANGAQASKQWTSSMLVDNMHFAYSSVLTAIAVNGTNALLNGTTATASLPSEQAANPVLSFTGQVADQGRQVTWSPEVNRQRTATIRNFAEDGSYTDYTLTLTRAVSTIDTCTCTLNGTDLLVVNGSPFQTIAIDRADSLYTITCTSEAGSVNVYTLRYVYPTASVVDTIAAVPFVSPIQPSEEDITPAEAPSASDLLSAILINGNPLAEFEAYLETYTVAPLKQMVIRPVPAHPAQSLQITRSNDTLYTTVTSEDRSASRTYAIRLYSEPSAVADLLAIQTNGTTISGFAPATYAYDIVLPSDSPKYYQPVMPDLTFITSDSLQSVLVELAPVGQPTYVTVTAADANSQQQYQLNIAAQLSSYAYLNAIAVNGELISGFQPDQLTYTVQLQSLEQPVIVYHRGDYFQTVEEAHTGFQNGQDTMTLTVTAEDGTTAVYTVTLVAPDPATDASLADIQLNGTTISGFDPATFAYDVVLPNGSQLPTISIQPNDPNAVAEWQLSDDTATIHVVAEDGLHTADYTIIFTILRSSENRLQMIYLDGDSLAAFLPEQTTYNLTIPVGGSRPEITWMKMEEVQQVTLTEEGLTSQLHVTAEDGSTRVYELIFVQLLSQVDTLQMIYEDGLDLPGFSGSQSDYSFDLPVGTTTFPQLAYEPGDAYQTVTTDTLVSDSYQQTIRFTAIAEAGMRRTYTVAYTILRSEVDTLQTIWIDNQPLEDFAGTTNNYTIVLPYGTTTLPDVDWQQGDAYQSVDTLWAANSLSLTVTAESGAVRIYLLQFTIARSVNPFLQSISIDGAEVNGFYPEQLTYQYTLPFGTTEMPAVSWTTADEQQVVDTMWTAQTLYINVTAGDGVTTANYIIDFPFLPSNNASLQMIYIDGEPIADFLADNFDYTDTLAYGTTTLPTITYLTSDDQQVVTMETTDATVSLLVTAGDGLTTEEYTITFIILLSPNNYLADLQANGATIPGFHRDSAEFHLIYPVATRETELLAASDITATPEDPDAQILLSDDADHTITIMVTAPNGDVRVYVITQEILLSDEARLQMIYLDSIELPDFDPDVIEYLRILAPGSIMPDVTATTLDPLATVEYGSFEDYSDAEGEGKMIEIDGVAENGDRLTYRVIFRYANWTATAESDPDDYIFVHVPGTDLFKTVTITIGLKVAIYDLDGQLLMLSDIPVADPADVTVDIADGNQILREASPDADGATFRVPQCGTTYFYVVFDTKNKRVAKGGKFMLIQ